MRVLREARLRRAAARARGRRSAAVRLLPGDAAAVRGLRRARRRRRASGCCPATSCALDAPGSSSRTSAGTRCAGARAARCSTACRTRRPSTTCTPTCRIRPTSDDVLGVSDYGAQFASVVGRGQRLRRQFHPEKSSVARARACCATSRRSAPATALGRRDAGMILYPAIDILDGQAVRLVQGDFDDRTVYRDSPLEAARAWVEAGARFLHIVDLDGAQAAASRATSSISRRSPRELAGAGAGRRRAALAGGRARRARRRRRARDPRHRGAARRRLPRRRARARTASA